MSHHIKPEQLLELNAVFELGNPSSVGGELISYPIKLKTVVEDFMGTVDGGVNHGKLITENGDNSMSDEMTLATQLLDSLDKAGYVIVKKFPLTRKHVGDTIETIMLSDFDNTIKLEDKVVASYSKNATISHGLISMTINFTDNTSLRLSATASQSDMGATLIAKYIEPKPDLNKPA